MNYKGEAATGPPADRPTAFLHSINAVEELITRFKPVIWGDGGHGKY